MTKESRLSSSLRMIFTGGAALGIGMLAQPAIAQQADTATAAAPQRVEITGSSIRRVDTETPSPVQVITADELKKSGYTSVAQVLSNITANGQGTLSQGFAGAFASGAQAISLRGLTSAATLVLIDGHRMAPNALPDDGQRSFVDTSIIPFDTIERIEVLKDGASAIYGSDAMAGVVNVILKKSFVGTTVNAEAGTTSEGGGATDHFSIIHGMGNYEEDGYNAYASLEYRHSNTITTGQRAGKGANSWMQTDFSGLGGENLTPGAVNAFNGGYGSGHATTLTPYLAPTTGTQSAATDIFYPGCTWDKMQAQGCTYTNSAADLVPKTQNINFLASFTKRLNDGWKLDTKASLFDSQDTNNGYGNGLHSFPRSYIGQVVGGPNTTPGIVNQPIAQITVPAGYIGPNGPIAAPMKIYGIIPDQPTIVNKIDSKNLRLVTDLTGSIGEWDIDSSLGYTKNQIKVNTNSLINTPALNAALNRTTAPFKIGGGNTASDIAAIFPSTQAVDTSTLAFAEFHATRALMELSGGDLGFSTGATYIYRKFDSPPSDAAIAGTGTGSGLSWVQGAQTNASAYAEVAAPVLKTLELDGAVRLDHYDGGVGNSTTPKLGFKWTPASMFALRGTYSTGFRAPTAAEVGNSGQTYGGGNTNDPQLCPNGDKTVSGAAVGYCNYGTTILNTANPHLSPEKSDSGTLGIILEPVKGWANTVDLYQIKIKNQIITGNPPALPVYGVKAPLDCAYGDGTTYTCPPVAAPVAAVGTVGTPGYVPGNFNAYGLPVYYPATYVNANSTTVKGLEFASSYKFKLGELGNLTTSYDWSHTMSYILVNSNGTSQLAGTHGPGIIGGDTGNPKDRMQAALTWDKNDLSVTTTFNWTSSYDLTDPSYPGFPVTDCVTAGEFGGWLPDGTVPAKYCKVASFLTADLTVGYKVSKQLFIHASINNAFNRQPPVDIQTYGSGAYPYNPSLHEAGVIGRFLNAGLTYSF